MTKDLNKEDFKNLFAELKEELNLKSADIARGIDTHAITISNLENKNIISVKTFFKLLNFFQKKGISAPEIFNKLINENFVFFYKIMHDKKLDHNKDLINFFQKANKIKADTESQIDNSVRIMKMFYNK